jgi:serine/threonine-protein kinase
MANVHLAMSAGSRGVSKLVVLKSLRDNLARDEHFVSMFLNEARLAARLNHRNVVQTYEVSEDEGHPVIVMEYLEGQSLAEIMLRAKELKREIPLAVHLRIIAETLAGLHYAHELADFAGKKLEIVHRDVSPHNIFVTYDGQVKVLDFGIAKAMSSASEHASTIIKGKLGYMAPEQMSGERIDRRADLYSVGVMLWEIAAGDRMWTGLQDVHVMKKVLAGDVPKLSVANPAVSPELAAIVERALEREPELRYADAAELERAVEDHLKTMGKDPKPREIGELVADLFSGVRAEMRALVEERIKYAEAVPSGEFEELSVPSVAPPALSRQRAGTGSLTATQTAGAMAPAPEKKRSAAWIPLALLGAVIGAFVAWRMWPPPPPAPVPTVDAARPPPAPPTVASASASAPAPVDLTIEISVSPASAKVTFDDVPLPNPYNGRMRPDGKTHKLRAEAAGYATREMDIVLDQNRSVSLALEKMSPSATATVAPPTVVRPPPTVSATATATVSAPPKPNCAVPYYIDSAGIKQIRPECN